MPPTTTTSGPAAAPWKRGGLPSDRRARRATQAQRSSTSGRLRIGLVAPPWTPVPPTGSGGIELMIDALARGLAACGHDVRLFTVGTSTCPVQSGWLHQVPPARIGDDLAGLCHAMAAYDYLNGCDVIHDHTLAGPALAAAGCTRVPVVSTNHGPFSAELSDLYRRVAGQVAVVAISADQAARAPVGVPVAAVIHHGVDLDRYPGRVRGGSGGFLLCLARMSPDKGVDVAVKTARRAGRRLVIAAKMREEAEHAYYHQVIEPLLDDSITYIGEADHATKIDLLRRADALLNPIQWSEPFGLVMIEALACGTPVIATPNGAAPEIVTPGVNGFLATSIEDLAGVVDQVEEIDRARCRRDAVDRFSLQAMAREHEQLYRLLVDRADRDPAVRS